jgi:DNA-binding NarL/FixJ family response regulator
MEEPFQHSRKSLKTHRVETPNVPSTVPEFPKNVVFAVLDDSAMIRVNLKITLIKQLGASPSSIFHGETEREALAFAKVCLTLKPDVVILDENLDYVASGGSLILGSSIAEDLRQLGYRGIIIMHSANELLRDTLDFAVVDGFIIKGSNRVLIRNEVARLLALKKWLD